MTWLAANWVLIAAILLWCAVCACAWAFFAGA